MQEFPFVKSEHGDEVPDSALISFARTGGFSTIVPGGESGVSASEWLSAELGLPASDPTHIFHRRDKNGMVARIRETSLRASVSNVVHDPSAIAAAVEEAGLPAVLKPANSAGSDLVRVVSTLAEAESHAAEIFGSTSILG